MSVWWMETSDDPFKYGLKKVPSSALGQVDFNAGQVTLKAYCKVPKVMRVVTCTFGFSTFLILLLSDGINIYSTWALQNMYNCKKK